MKSSINCFLLIIVFVLIFAAQNTFSSEASQKKLQFINKESNPEQFYKLEVTDTIGKIWVPIRDKLNENQDIFANVYIKVLPDGKMSGFRFDKKSGSVSFDSAVEEAIKLSNPLPPFPEGIDKEFLEIGLHFAPKPL